MLTYKVLKAIFNTAMINRPQLVKQQAAFTAEPETKAHAQKEGSPTNLTPQSGQGSQGNAKFIMGLNNRIAKQEKRLDNIEHHLKQAIHASNKQLKNHIGYKELGLTLALSLLIFTSLGFFFTNQTTTDNKLLKQLLDANPVKANPNSKGKVQIINKDDSSIFNRLTPTATDKPVFGNIQYKWPLEKQRKLKGTNYSSHKHGININAKLGDPVVAIENGTVIFSDDNIADYGNLVLIQHPNNIISVYGNNYSNYVKKGQSIRKGELLAAVGETNGNQPRLYFEIRYKGKAQDPFLYFK
jgi:murein DD-endopeptidase MepM/ murein hydrolase activator NlpD